MPLTNDEIKVGTRVFSKNGHPIGYHDDGNRIIAHAGSISEVLPSKTMVSIHFDGYHNRFVDIPVALLNVEEKAVKKAKKKQAPKISVRWDHTNWPNVSWGRLKDSYSFSSISKIHLISPSNQGKTLCGLDVPDDCEMHAGHNACTKCTNKMYQILGVEDAEKENH